VNRFGLCSICSPLHNIRCRVKVGLVYDSRWPACLASVVSHPMLHLLILLLLYRRLYNCRFLLRKSHLLLLMQMVDRFIKVNRLKTCAAGRRVSLLNLASASSFFGTFITVFYQQDFFLARGGDQVVILESLLMLQVETITKRLE